MKKLLLSGLGIVVLSFVFQYDYTSLEVGEFTAESLLSSKKMAFATYGNKPTGYVEYMNSISKRDDQKKSSYLPNYRAKALEEAESKLGAKQTRQRNASDFESVSRGPGNVGGRTRALIVDPDDATKNTWFAGSAGGGIWKTKDKGASWTNISSDLPNLATNALAMAASNHNIIYAGTGEVFGGNLSFVRGDGVFKSIDRGVTWVQLVATASNVKYNSVNGIVVDPANADIVVMCTNTGVYKSIDGGTSWIETFLSNTSVQDIEVNSSDFSSQYVGVNGYGVFKSTDAGSTWAKASKGLGSISRVELAVSPQDGNYIYACSYDADNNTLLYRSVDAGVSWALFVDADGNNANFLGEQGWYDNTLGVNPYDKDEVYVGGVYLGKSLFNGDFGFTDPAFLGVDEENTSSFLAFVNFSATAFGGALEIGDGDDKSDTFTNVEIRFGAGLKQKGHRFTVPSNGGTNSDGGAGIGAADYKYADYIDVPFQVWDIDGNRQLMVSFRDQENNGVFNLNKRDDTNDPDLLKAREYIFISNVTYSTTKSDVVGKDGGHLAKNMYFFWPILAANAANDWDESNLPTSIMRIKYGVIKTQKGSSEYVSDSRGDQGSKNGNLHADHHNLTMIPMDASAKEFRILNGNDGGLGLSEDNGETWTQILDGYVTTQFYGAAKKPGADEYFGGMQDNGTWQSTAGKTASATSKYTERLGGDGFEVLWHAKDSKKVMGSIYNNRIYRSTDGGLVWNTAQNGITTEDTQAPFITRLASSDTNPDVIFATSSLGIYKSTNFGQNWALKPISVESGWTVTSNSIPFVTSSLEVDVSNADHDVVWGGSAMDANRNIFVSIDGGEIFTATAKYSKALGGISGIGTHPNDSKIAYVLFSQANAPKVLRTKDQGKTWEDISGFGTGTMSMNGFPNVMVHSLLVLPHEPTTILVGTEIGLFESKDDGATWALADYGVPHVSIWNMEVRDDQIILATYGRGIWTMKSSALLKTQATVSHGEYQGNKKALLHLKLPVAYDSVEVFVAGKSVATIQNPTTTITANSETGLYPYEVTVEPTNEPQIKAHIKSHVGEESYVSGATEIEVNFAATVKSFAQSTSDGNKLDVVFDITEMYDSFEMYLNDELVKTVTSPPLGDLAVAFDVSSSGRYILKSIGKIESLSFTSALVAVSVEVLAIGDEVNDAIELYPNPAIDYINYDVSFVSVSSYSVDVINIQGKVIQSEVKLKSTATESTSIQYLPKGMYILRVIADGEMRMSKFMKK